MTRNGRPYRAQPHTRSLRLHALEQATPPAQRYEVYRRAPALNDQRYGRTVVVDFKTALRTAQAIASALNTVVDVDEVTPLTQIPYANFEAGGHMQWCASPNDAEAAGFVRTQEGWQYNVSNTHETDSQESSPTS